MAGICLAPRGGMQKAQFVKSYAFNPRFVSWRKPTSKRKPDTAYASDTGWSLGEWISVSLALAFSWEMAWMAQAWILPPDFLRSGLIMPAFQPGGRNRRHRTRKVDS